MSLGSISRNRGVGSFSLPYSGMSFKRFIAVGDSITAEAPSGGWPAYFSLLSNGEYICTYNAAVAGITLPTMASQFASIPSWVKADIVMIQGGTNSPGITTANKDADVCSWCSSADPCVLAASKHDNDR